MTNPNPQALPPRCPHCGDVLVDDGDWYCMGLYGHAPAPTKRERKGYASPPGRDAPGAHTIRLSQGYAVFGSTVAEPPPSSAEADGEPTVCVPVDLARFELGDAQVRDWTRKWVGDDSPQPVRGEWANPTHAFLVGRVERVRVEVQPLRRRAESQVRALAVAAHRLVKLGRRKFLRDSVT